MNFPGVDGEVNPLQDLDSVDTGMQILYYKHCSHPQFADDQVSTLDQPPRFAGELNRRCPPD
jgi:hypothetical protein